jgi:hypothetical protein
MMKSIAAMSLLILTSFTRLASADVCPLPISADLVPVPWQVFPTSIYPQYEPGIRFVQVQIPPQVISGVNGVICTYRTSLGDYSIWQQKFAKPSSFAYWFQAGKKGEICSQSISDCPFIIFKDQG